MADFDQGKKRGYLCAGYAASGYQKRQRPDGHIYCGFGAANPVFCGAERTGEHTQAAGGGHSGGKGQRG